MHRSRLRVRRHPLLAFAAASAALAVPNPGGLAARAGTVPGDRREIAILAVHDVQGTELPSGSSPHAGEFVRVAGVVVAAAPLGRWYSIADPEGGPWSGLRVDGPALERRPGEWVLVTGIVAELFAETRLLQTSVSTIGEAALPPATTVPLSSLANDGERWEGVLVRVESPQVETLTDRFGEYRIGDATASNVVVDDEFFTSYIGDPGDTFSSITGIVSYGFGSFRLEPRGDEDLAGWISGRAFNGRLRVTVVDEGGEPLPSKITIFPTGGFSLDLGPDDRAEASKDVAYLAQGRGEVALPFGTYDVVVSRGIEYGLHRQRVTVGTGVSGEVHATLRHEVDTTGWISGDFHLHSAPSFDTPLPVPGRIVSLAGEGVEWAVATDHNEITDYAPVIRRLRLQRWITSSVGDEITTRSPSYGHFNAWPLVPGGEPLPYEGVTPQQLFDGARRDPGVQIVQVNHPSFGPGGDQYFDVYGLDPNTGVPEDAGFSFDFDAIEVMNGTFTDQGLLNFRSWLTLQRIGRRITATGNSDSHHIVFREPGYPRNFVRSDAGTMEAVDESKLVDAVLQGRTFVTYGPIVDLVVNGAGLGALVAADGGAAHLDVRVQCASWLQASELRILANGVERASFPLKAAPGEPLDASFAFSHEPSIDTSYLVFVEGVGDLSPVARSAGLRPLAFTNPVYVDVDGDGEFTAPGLFADALPIDAIDAVDAAGVPVRLGEWVALRGCTSTGGEFPNPGTGGFYLDDGTGGVRVEEPLGVSSGVSRGERVSIAGVVGQVLGETRILEALVVPEAAPCGAPSPTLVTTGGLADAEPLEGRAVRVTGANLTAGAWPKGGTAGQVVVDDGTGPVALSVPAGVVVPPEAAQLVDFTFTALVSQRDFSPPYTSGYGLLLRDGADLFEDAGSFSTSAASAGAQRTVLLAPRPNPSRGAIALAFVRGDPDLGKPLHIRVTDVGGRTVRRLAVERAEPGAGTVAWDGLDESGVRVASGIYFVNLVGGAPVEARRIVRLR